MRFLIKVASDSNQKPCKAALEENGKWYAEIECIEALLLLAKEVGHPIIVDNDDPPEITIYDGYVE